MKRIITILLIVGLIISSFGFLISTPITSHNLNPNLDNLDNHAIINNIEHTQIITNFNKLNGFFIENRGQIDNDSVRYYIQGEGVWFLNDGVVFEIMESIESKSQGVGSRESIDAFDRLHPKFEPVMPVSRKSVVLKLNFEDANKVVPKGAGMLSHKSNFFYGNDSSKWGTNVPNYQEIVYENIFDNIDLKYYNSPKGLKYDFIVHPGGNPNDIKMSYEGAEQLNIDSSGNLKVETLIGDILDSDLFIYQDIDDDKNNIKGCFNILNSTTFGFEILVGYDSNYDLIIDPLIYSTFMGGAGNDNIGDIVVDTYGNVYVTGGVGKNFPTTPGAYDTTHNDVGGSYGDGAVFKLSSSGSQLIYSTYIGGQKSDGCGSIKIDSNGNAYVSGGTNSPGFPTTAGAFDQTFNGDSTLTSNNFIFKLDPTGSLLLYSTFIGGTDNEGAGELILDSNGNVLLTGLTESTDFPTTAGAFDITYNGGRDIFILKLNPAGTGINDLIFSTYFGSSAHDDGGPMALDSNGNIYLTGCTRLSTDFPITPGAYDPFHNGNSVDEDVFITKINPTGSTLLYSTFIGGPDIECGFRIAVNSNGYIFVTGDTKSINFPTTLGAFNTAHNSNGFKDIFVLKFNPAGNGPSDLIYSTFIGGNDDEWSYGLALDSSSNVYVSGHAWSPNFPTTINAYDNTFNGSTDAFIFKLNSTGSSLLYSTFLGGSNADVGDKIAIDSNRNIYMTAWTNSPDFPITPGVYDPVYDDFGEGVVLKISFNNSPLAIGLQISKPSILRTNPIYLYSNATDLDDSEQDLAPIFEYRDSNELIWNSTHFSNFHYNNSRWEVCFTPYRNAALGLYDFRVRYYDSGMAFSNWYYLNNSLTVLNNIPEVIDFSLLKNTSIMDQNIFVHINASDIENEDQNLTIELNYRDSAELIWNTTYFSFPKYIDNRWECSFYVPFTALFGYYDFRVRCNDSDGDFSAWLYFNDSLLVYNTNPNVVDLKVTNNAVFRTNSVFIFINGSDYETPENMLMLNAQFKQKNKTNWTDITSEYSSTNNNWKVEFITEIETILGLYDLRVTFIDNESASSGWFHFNDTLEVLNNPPKISETLDEINVGIGPRFIDLTSYESDIEDSDENLIWIVDESNGYEFIESVRIIDIENDILEIIPKENVAGQEEVKLTLSDKDNGIDLKSDLTIQVDSVIIVPGEKEYIYKVNLTAEKYNIIIKQGYSTTLNLTVKNEGNVTDNYKIEYNSDMLQTQINFNKSYIALNPGKKGLIILSINIPKIFQLGDYPITITSTSLIDVKIKDQLTINVKVVSEDFIPNYGVKISVSPTIIEMFQGESGNVMLNISNIGNVFDEYDLNIESINYTFENIKLLKTFLLLGATKFEEIEVIISIPINIQIGMYDVKFTSRSEYTEDNAILKINVKEKIDNDLVEGNLKPSNSKTDNALFPLILIIIFLIIISCLFIGKTEVGKYKILTLIFVPLLSKFQREKKSDNFTRGQILGYIKARPGEHYNAIKYALELNNGTLAYHVRILEKGELIYSKRDGLYTRFYPVGAKIQIADEPPLNEIQKNIVEKIEENPGITQHEIIDSLDTSQQVISYNLSNLTRDNIIKTEQNGREKRYFLNHD